MKKLGRVEDENLRFSKVGQQPKISVRNILQLSRNKMIKLIKLSALTVTQQNFPREKLKQLFKEILIISP